MSDKREQFAVFFEEHFDSLYRYFLIKTLDKPLAEDLTSETFVALAEKLKSDPDIRNGKSYLFGIARNILNQHLRSKYLTSDIQIDVERIEAGLDESGLRTMAILEETLKECLDKLPKKQAAILRLRFVERLSFKEMGSALKKSADYVKTTQRRAIASMRRLVAEGICIPKLTNKHE